MKYISVFFHLFYFRLDIYVGVFEFFFNVCCKRFLICKSLWIKASAKLLKCKKYATIVLFRLGKNS